MGVDLRKANPYDGTHSPRRSPRWNALTGDGGHGRVCRQGLSRTHHGALRRIFTSPARRILANLTRTQKQHRRRRSRGRAKDRTPHEQITAWPLLLEGPCRAMPSTWCWPPPAPTRAAGLPSRSASCSGCLWSLFTQPGEAPTGRPSACSRPEPSLNLRQNSPPDMTRRLTALFSGTTTQLSACSPSADCATTLVNPDGQSLNCCSRSRAHR